MSGIKRVFIDKFLQEYKDKTPEEILEILGLNLIDQKGFDGTIEIKAVITVRRRKKDEAEQ